MRTRTRSRFPADRQLTVRMTATAFLLGLVYAAFAAALFALLGAWLPVVAVAAALLGAQYWFSDRLALFAMRGRVVTPAEQPRLHAVVDRLCAAADMAKPGVAIADTALPNAFATGRDPHHAVVCVTTGLIRRLDEDELEAVLAHELSHVAHRDVAVITVASSLGVLAGLLVRMTFYGALFGGRGRQSNPAFLALLMLVMLVSAVVYALGFLLTRTLSRYRELAADRGAALVTGRPSALATALTKLDAANARIPARDLRTAQSFNAFFVTPVGGGAHARLSGLLSTHPSLEVRLRKLAEFSTGLGRPSK